jgi:hypothetical protein
MCCSSLKASWHAEFKNTQNNWVFFEIFCQKTRVYTQIRRFYFLFCLGDYYISRVHTEPAFATLRSRARTTHWWTGGHLLSLCVPAGGPSGGPGVPEDIAYSPRIRGLERKSEEFFLTFSRRGRDFL